MPNLKIFVDDSLFPVTRTALSNTLGPIRDMLCADLNVPASACQVAVMTVLAMPDLPRVKVEIQFLPRPERTKALVTGVCTRLRDLAHDATGTHVAVRASALDPETHIALKEWHLCPSGRAKAKARNFQWTRHSPILQRRWLGSPTG